MGTMKTLAELFDETEAAAQARYAEERAVEKARVDALTPAQREAEIEAQRVAYETKWAAFDAAVESDDDEDEGE